MRTSYYLIIVLIALSIVGSIMLYPIMPDQMASHWNAAGQVDGQMPKIWGLFLMPVIAVAMLLLFMAIPCIDPLKKNIQKFMKYFDNFIVLIVVFLLYIHTASVAWNLGYRFSMTYVILPAIALIFYYSGVLIEHAKMNWFIGIRTPWTLSSEKVWKKTHELGAKVFKALAFVMLLGIVLPPAYLTWWILLVVVAALYPVLYSYLEFRKEKR